MTSATTQPRDRAYWTTVIHNAAQVKPDEPRYGEARQVIQMGLEGLQGLADSSAEQDIKDISPGKFGTALVAFGHGASLGLAGDPTYLQLAKDANPKTALLSDMAGTAALGAIASPLVAGASPAVGGAIIGGTLGGARGAIEPIPGMSRGESAALMGAGGAVTGALVSKFVSKLMPNVRAIYGNVARMLGGDATQEQISSVTQNAIRAQLAKMGVKPEVIERAATAWQRAVLKIKVPTPEVPEVPVTSRPGETITQVAPKGFEVSGERVTPPPPANGSFWEQIHGPSVRDLGKGQTLPYYPRGGAVEQSMAPFPTRSPSVSPTPDAVTEKQLPMMLEWLKGAPAGEESARIATLRALGVPLGPTAETDLLQFLGRTPQ